MFDMLPLLCQPKKRLTRKLNQGEVPKLSKCKHGWVLSVTLVA